MSISTTLLGKVAAGVLFLTATSFGQSLAPDLKIKLEARIRQLETWSTNPELVAAVRAHNSNPPADAKGMDQEKWQKLTVLDPFVRSYTKTPLAMALKAKKDESVSECFVSGADGTKVALLAKTTNWSHAGKDKHTVPMTGKRWIGPVEVDESSGQQQVQVGLPVLDGGKPIGSIVFGLSVARLK
jgi:hypothetical protein